VVFILGRSFGKQYGLEMVTEAGRVGGAKRTGSLEGRCQAWGVPLVKLIECDEDIRGMIIGLLEEFGSFELKSTKCHYCPF